MPVNKPSIKTKSSQQVQWDRQASANSITAILERYLEFREAVA